MAAAWAAVALHIKPINTLSAMKNHPHFWPTARPLRGSAAALRRQHGAFLITFALFMLFLLGFMGIALDFGRLFVVKTELQTAVDSCALAAARELNGQADAITRAQSAGMAAGNANNANLQSTSWNGAGKITASDIDIFRDKEYLRTTDAQKAHYAECKYTMSSIKLWLLQAMGAFTGDSTTWPNTGAVGVRAVATRVSSQSACIIPVAIRWDIGLPSVGEWIPFDPGSKSKDKNMTWGNLNGSTNASTTEADMLNGYCVTPKPGAIFTPGTQANKIAAVWNYRFGIYSNSDIKNGSVNYSSTGQPDYSSYTYTTSNSPGHDVYQDFLNKRLAFMPCGRATHPEDCGVGNGGYQTVSQAPVLKANGADRRVVTVPVIKGNANQFNNELACMLILAPLQPSSMTSAFEYLGLANDPKSPCKGSGYAGGTTGPVVPVLVR